MGSTSNIVATTILIFIGASFIIGGITVVVMFPTFYREGIMKEKVLKPESKFYEQWVEPTIPIYMEFYFFNCTNIKGFIEYEEKPVLEELGPYVFREYRKKINITHVGDQLIGYRQSKNWHFEPDMSHGTLDDIVTTLNVPVITAGHQSRFKTFVPKFILASTISSLKAQLHVSKPVRQFLFEGYNDVIIDFAKDTADLTQTKVPFDKFGWFYQKNDSNDGIYVINNGNEDVENVGFIKTWKNMSVTPFFKEYCNFINGTAADVFPPFMNHVEKLEFFSGDLCRSLTFVFDKNEQVDGIDVRRFKPKPFLLDDGYADESNKCFCNGECLEFGLLNISSCRFGAPAFVSFPHFLNADRVYRENVVGMSPDPDKHGFIMDIQPDLGIPANVAARLQINILVQHIDGLGDFEQFSRKTFFPMFWFAQKARVDGESARQLKFFTKSLTRIVNGTAYMSIGLGMLLLLIAVLINVHYHYKMSKQRSRGEKYMATSQVDDNEMKKIKA